jgi:hypothetical protein
VRELGCVFTLKGQRSAALLVLLLEHADEDLQRQEPVDTELEELDLVVADDGLSLRVGERQPGGLLDGVHLVKPASLLGFPALKKMGQAW